MRRTALVAMMLMLPAAGLAAQASKLSAQLAAERGFRADAVYQVTPFDVVNLFSGGLQLDIPVGGTYRVSDSLTYQIRLRYSTSAWTLFERCPDKFPGEIDPDCRSRMMLPPEHSNAGLGWLIGFGELRTFDALADDETGFTYKSPDGAEHNFFEVLHHGDAEDANDPDGKAIGYTRDGTYLRMRVHSATVRLVEFANGEKHRFELRNGEWQLTHIFNGFSTLAADATPSNNYVRFDYPASPDYAGVNDITLTDSRGRVQAIRFKPSLLADGPPELSSVVLTTYQGGSPATYRFQYQTNPDGSEAISVYKPYDAAETADTITTRLLSAIELPSGEKFQFEYSTPATFTHDSGLLQQMILPTLGKIEWDYAVGNFASDLGYETDTGVSARRVYNRSLSSSAYILEQYTKYVSTLGSALVQTMTAWSDNQGTGAKVDAQVRNHFDNSTGGMVGLPFAWSIAGADNRKLSTQAYDCDPSTEVCTLERETWVRYEIDELSSACVNGRCLYDRNRRLLSEKTVFVTDGSHWTAATNSDFDGLGHYRTVSSSSSFGPTRIQQTSYNSNTRGHNAATRTGSSVGTYAVNDNFVRTSETTFTMLQPTDAWVLGTYSGQEIGTHVFSNSPGSDDYRPVFRSETCFEVATGFPERQRTLGHVNVPQTIHTTVQPRASDLLSVFAHDNDGNILREEYFGGDAAATLSTNASPCAVPTSQSSGTFRLDHTLTNYNTHYTRTAQYKDAAGAATGSLNFFAGDLDFDRSSDAVLRSRDTSGIATTYVYDPSGRLTWVKPETGHGAWTQYEYLPASATASGRAEVVIRQRPNGSVSGVLTQAVLEYDGLGRLFRERKQLQDGSWSSTDTRYDHAGRKAKVSVTGAWAGHAVDASKWTTMTHDAFGRTLEIKTPDGKSSSSSYTGARISTRTRSIATSAAGEQSVVVEEEYDSSGNLKRVREASGTASWVEAVYTYDLLDRLTGVSMGGNGSPVQNRSFIMDGRGFLTSEQHPESGTTTYQYDARGHAVSRTRGGVALSFGFDRAERLSTVTEQGAPLKEFFYDRSNSTNDFSRGKMARAVRHNYQAVLGGDVTVTETYVYGGIGGALSSKLTALSTGETFADSYAYTDLGAVRSVTYPRCGGAPCSGIQQPPARTVENSYVNGYLSTVGAYASIDYWPNGMLKSVRHQNAGVVPGTFTPGPLYKQTIDATTEMPRPHAIEISGVCRNLSVLDQPDSASITAGQGATLSVAVAGATEYRWFTGDGTQAGTGTSITVSPTASTTYWVRASNGTCTIDSAPAVVTVTGGTPACPAPVANITAPGQVQAGSTGTASVPFTQGATYAWTITGGTIVSGSGTREITFQATCSGSVSVHVAVTAACGTRSDSDRVVPAAAATIHVSGSTSIAAAGEGADLIADLTGLAPWSITWSDGVVEDNITVTPWRRRVFPTVSTSYTATVVNANGCSGTSDGVATISVGGSCAAPASSISGAPGSMMAGSTATVSVPATPGAAYGWSVSGGGIVSGRGTPSITFNAGCSGTVTVSIVVTAQCGTYSTSSSTSNVTPRSASLTGSSTNQGQSGTLTVVLEGTSPWTLTWSDGAQETAYASPYVHTVSVQETTSYTVSASDSGGCSVTSNAATVTVVPPAPVLQGAVALAGTGVRVSWTFTGATDTFNIERFDRLPGSPAVFRTVGTAAAGARSFDDPSLADAASALYRVVAVKAGTLSAPSAVDVATTIQFVDDPIVVHVTRARTSHITQLRTAVNAMRNLAGLGAAAFTDPTLSSTTMIRRLHITELRTALDAARSALGLPPVLYSDQPLPENNLIRASHVTDVRGGVK